MEARNFAQHWCSVMVQGLIDRQIDHFFVAPGSRSTPLVSAIAKNSKAKISLGIDERSVGFLALGYGKRAQKPGVVVVTSGTAAANLTPAVVEAYLSAVPLFIVTADRPYELRDCGANQTIWQANMFANHINKSFDLAPPAPVVPLNQSLAIFEQALRFTIGLRKGPVHVNLQFREPLANLPDDSEASWSESAFTARSLLKNIEPTSLNADVAGLVEFLSSDRGLIVVGELLPSRIQNQILDLSSRINWPVYADITSNLRLRHHPNLLHHGDLGLLCDEFIGALKTDRVLKLGARIVSKRWWAWMEKAGQGQFLSISESPERIDHVGRFEHVQVADLFGLLSSLTKNCAGRSATTRISDIKAILARASLSVDKFLENKCDNEGYYVARLIARMNEPVNLFLSSGMPIRDADQFAKPCEAPIDVFANRGASGIDGVLSSAVGVAIADAKPVVLVIGDVAFLHDTNGLMLLKQTTTPVLVVVINNGGGGIFHLLPIASEPDVITPYLDTPHDVNIGALCQAHHVTHHRVLKPSDFDQHIRSFFIVRKSMVLEVTIDRATNVRLHKDLYAEIAEGDISGWYK